MKTLKKLSVISILSILIVVAAIRISHSNQNKTQVPVSATINVQTEAGELRSLATKNSGSLNVVLFLKDITSGETRKLGQKTIQINGEEAKIASTAYYNNTDQYKFYIAQQKIHGLTCTLDDAPSFSLTMTQNNQNLNYTCSNGNATAGLGKVAVGYYTQNPDAISAISTSGTTDSLENTIKAGYNVIDLAFLNFDSQANSIGFFRNKVKCTSQNDLKDASVCISELKEKYPNIKIIASIGGEKAKTPTMTFLKNSNNVQKLIDIKNKYHLDGFDFDIENTAIKSDGGVGFENFIKKLHQQSPELYLTFAPQSPMLTYPMYETIWSNLIAQENSSTPWLGWYQVQFYNQDNTQPDPSWKVWNDPFGKRSSFASGVYKTKYQGPYFSKHFVVGTPASVFAASTYLGSGYTSLLKGSAHLSACSQLAKASNYTPSGIAQTYIDNATSNGHGDIRGFMTWDTYNDFYTKNYNCNNSSTPKWQSYGWIKTIDNWIDNS